MYATIIHDPCIARYIPNGIALHSSERAGSVQGRGHAHGRTVELGVGLGAVPTQEQAAQIGHGGADKCGQFRVRAGGLHEGLGQGSHKVTDGGINWAIFRGSWNGS